MAPAPLAPVTFGVPVECEEWTLDGSDRCLVSVRPMHVVVIVVVIVAAAVVATMMVVATPIAVAIAIAVAVAATLVRIVSVPTTARAAADHVEFSIRELVVDWFVHIQFL